MELERDSNSELAEYFDVSRETVEKANNLSEKVSAVDPSSRKKFTEEALSAIERKDKKKIKEIRRTLRISELKSEDAPIDKIGDSARTLYKVSRGARQPIHSERDLVRARADAVGEYVASLGFSRQNSEELLGKTLVFKCRGITAPGEVASIGPYRFIGIRKKELLQKGSSVLDHEILHTYQHRFCPEGLSEGLTSYFEKKIAESRGEKHNATYFLDQAFVSMLERAVGEEALAEAYFSLGQKEMLDKLNPEDRAVTENVIKSFGEASKLIVGAFRGGDMLTLAKNLPEAYFKKLTGLIKARRVLEKYFDN
jgi:hypothetical protein